MHQKYLAVEWRKPGGFLAPVKMFCDGAVRQRQCEQQNARDSKIGKIYEGTSNMQLATIAKLVLAGG